MSPHLVRDRLAGLRSDFDRSFTEPVRRHDAEHAELLAIRAGGRPYVLRLSQSSGLYPDRPVTPLPGPLPALLGVAGFGGGIVPVYDLAALLGHPIADRPRWLVLAAGTPPLALAFHELDGHLRVPAATIVTEGRQTDGVQDDGDQDDGDQDDGDQGDGAQGAGSLRGMVPLPGGTRPIVDLPATRTAVHRLTGHRDTHEER